MRRVFGVLGAILVSLPLEALAMNCADGRRVAVRNQSQELIELISAAESDSRSSNNGARFLALAAGTSAYACHLESREELLSVISWYENATPLNAKEKKKLAYNLSRVREAYAFGQQLRKKYKRTAGFDEVWNQKELEQAESMFNYWNELQSKWADTQGRKKLLNYNMGFFIAEAFLLGSATDR